MLQLLQVQDEPVCCANVCDAFGLEISRDVLEPFEQVPGHQNPANSVACLITSR
jgi:hypothetical protein